MPPSSGASSKFSSALTTASFRKTHNENLPDAPSARAAGDYIGAMAAGGRWNPIGTPMLYAARYAAFCGANRGRFDSILDCSSASPRLCSPFAPIYASVETREQQRKTIQQAADDFLVEYKLQHESATFAVYALGHVTAFRSGPPGAAGFRTVHVFYV
jgi:hypothetical protein